MLQRRAFLRFLAGSPLLTGPMRALAEVSARGISDPSQALSVLDFEPLARDALVPAHWSYMASGVDGDLTVLANRAGFGQWALRPRRLVDVSTVDTSIELFGQRLSTPLLLSPVGGLGMYAPDGERVTARAARAGDTVQILSTVSASPVASVAEARGGPVWFQLYARPRWQDTLALIRNAEAAGSPVLVWTVDLIPGRNMETDLRGRMADATDCSACHVNDPRAPRPRGEAAPFTWDFVRRLKDATDMKLVIKGIETGEDAARCVEYGADGILVSNHGGRATETGRATIACLPEVVHGADGRVPVLVDGGFRRGTDVFKALALGAAAVCYGRPYVWGLSAFGQPGVERVIAILRAELELAMRQCGTTSIAAINDSYLTAA